MHIFLGRKDMKTIRPFGMKFFEPVCKPETSDVENWDWKPVEGARLDLINDNVSIPGTTGTGPTASEDERSEES
jgi:hypothetical protein